METKAVTRKLEFNNKRSCGLWLILVGAVLGVSLIFGGKFIANPVIFLAGYYAGRMGVPIGRLICASNSNKVLYDFFTTGTYDRNREFILTSSPSRSLPRWHTRLYVPRLSPC